ncbi:MAG: response regulator [Kofleriaceae bacterium]|jgi:DNA-binding response OmpR family regulator|nr:response regulator [Kofleriaceae bacterium]MBP6839238.1 response regulator [Kofleriaceae bacterium]MBP9206713.1 response regulator [Kofleriaceae bacterium]
MAKILIIDDEPDVVRLLAKTLAVRGHTVVTARDGAEALRRAGDDVPDLIIVDRHLPKIDGNEVCRRLRLTPSTKAVPILMMTAAEVALEDVTAAGAPDAFVLRPFLREIMASNVERLLAQRRPRRVTR